LTTNVTTALVALLLILLCLSGVAAAADTPVEKEKWGCRWSERWREVAVDKPADHSDTLTPPKKVHHTQIVWPENTPPHTGSGVPIVEAVVDADGKVADVRIVRPISWEPPWPEFDNAITHAIRKWEYTPATLGDRPVPFCLTITININWK
jgi:TonB family protein